MRITAAGLVGVCAAVLTGLLLGYYGHGLKPQDGIFSCSVGVLAACAAWLTISKPEPVRIRGWAAWSAVAAFTLFSLRAFCWLVYFKDDDVAFLSPNNLGDLSLHLTYTRYFANGAPFWPDNPIYAAVKLHYPFGVDLLNSLLTLAGVDLYRGFIWVGLLGCAATGVALWRWGGPFTVAGFLFNGGVAGFTIFQTHVLKDYQETLGWKSIPLALFVTQRGLLYAIPAGLALLWSWRNRFFKNKPGLPLWVEVVLYSTMPLFHLHTFLFLSALLGCWLLLPCRKRVLPVILFSLVPATVLIWLLTGGFQSSHMIHLKPGWMQNDDPNDQGLYFWLHNFGAWPVAIIALCIWIAAKKDVARAAIVVPSLLVFAICCFVMFAPWDWDNTKLMIWSYLAILPALWAMLEGFSVPTRAIACVVLYFSGFISLAGGLNETHRGYTLASRKELDYLTATLTDVPPTATFACHPTYNHPLLLTGHKVVAGYEGHLGSHGIDYHETLATLKSLLNGGSGWEDDARKLHADFLYWGTEEHENYPNSPTPWSDKLPVFAQDEMATVYDLRPLRKSPPPQ